jgi:hypothetical protein
VPPSARLQIGQKLAQNGSPLACTRPIRRRPPALPNITTVTPPLLPLTGCPPTAHPLSTLQSPVTVARRVFASVCVCQPRRASAQSPPVLRLASCSLGSIARPHRSPPRPPVWEPSDPWGQIAPLMSSGCRAATLGPLVCSLAFDRLHMCHPLCCSGSAR